MSAKPIGWIVQYDAPTITGTKRFTVTDHYDHAIVFAFKSDAISAASALDKGTLVPLIRYRRTAADRRRDALEPTP